MPSIEDTVCTWCNNRPLTMTDMVGVVFNFFKYIHNDVKFMGKTASWLVILSSVNLCFPDFLRRLRDGHSMRGVILRMSMYMLPLIIHSVFWTQYVHLWTFCLTRLGLAPSLIVQWTSFISGVTSLAYLYVSLWLTGIVEGPPFPWSGNGKFTRSGQGTVCTRLRLDTGLQVECCAEQSKDPGMRIKRYTDRASAHSSRATKGTGKTRASKRKNAKKTYFDLGANNSHEVDDFIDPYADDATDCTSPVDIDDDLEDSESAGGQ